MEQDQRLTPLPKSLDLRAQKTEYPSTYPAFYDDEVSEGRRSIQQYFNVVKKRLPIILALTALATAAAAFYMYRLPSQYMATTEIVIEPRKPKVQSKDSININFGNDANYYNTQLELLQNTDLMKEVVIRLGLYKDPDLFGNEDRGVLSGMRSIFSSSKSETSSGSSLPVVADVPSGGGTTQTIQLTPEERDRAESYAATLAGRLSVVPRERTNIVNVSITTPKPELSARVADKVAEVFIEKDGERETEGARRAYEDLTKSIEDLKHTISEQETELISVMSSSNLPLQDKGGDLRAADLAAMLTKLREAENETSKIQALYTGALNASGKGDILAVVGDNKAIQDARSQNLKRQADLEKRIEDIDGKINVAREKRETLLVRYTPEYKDVVAVDAQIKELEAQKTRINQEVSEKIKSEGTKLEKNAEREVLAGLRSQLGAAQQRESQARAEFAQASSKANIEGQAETKLTTLKREIETKRSLLDTYTQRQKEQELAIASGRPDNIKVAASAITPGGPIGPQRTRNIFVAFLVSFAVGIGLAFLLDYLDDSVKTSDDIGRHLGLPTLALIPHHFGSEKRRLRLAAANGNGNANGNGGNMAVSTGLITLEERRSPMAEAYRHLRTSLLFSSAGKPPQSILVTSSQPSEGKTTTAINTAVTLAQADADVVIVDCDLRRPRLHSYFDLDNTQGLTNYLSGERNTEHLIKSCKELPRLKVITSGPIPPNPAELLSSNEMKNLLQFLRGRYKHIIIDSPPAISFTDAAILSTLVDGVVIVAMAGKSSIHLMRRFKHRLGNIGARIYGVVLNGIKSGSMEYDYYGSGYYEYYAKSDADTSTPVMEEMGTIHQTKP
ncbi:MAG TPA: polysaccharide biosynthesis tyrosine autokinase [Pyrinomonadaceae bacterium]|nr:polysaccharide biosynthesis tyrosine autokinase [Pyrinomonadaceae bacterium]